MKSKKVKTIMHSVGLMHNLPDKVVEEIIYSVFEMVKRTMESGNRDKIEFENIQVLNFGKFYVPQGRKDFLKKLNEKNESIRNKELRDTDTT